MTVKFLNQTPGFILHLLSINQLHRPGLLPAVSFSLDAGETLCISGPSGVGKTILLRSIADLDPNQGEVLFKGRLRESIGVTEWRRQVMLVPSESHWWASLVGEHFTALDGIPMQKLGFTDSVMGWEVARLSSGERQRLAVLRALSLKPSVVLLDEPTANLDQENTLRMENLLQEFRDEYQAALLWVSHSEEQRRRVADRELRLTATGLMEMEQAT